MHERHRPRRPADLAVLVDRRASSCSPMRCFPQQRAASLPFVALVGLAASALWTTSWVARDDYAGSLFGGSLALDNFTVFFYFLFVGITAAVDPRLARLREPLRPPPGRVLRARPHRRVGLMLLAAARDLIAIFVALELTRITQYILAGLRKDEQSTEAGMKYLLLGAIASP